MIAGHMNDWQFRDAYRSGIADTESVDPDVLADYMHDFLSPVFDPEHERTLDEYLQFRELCLEYALRYSDRDALNS